MDVDAGTKQTAACIVLSSCAPPVKIQSLFSKSNLCLGIYVLLRLQKNSLKKFLSLLARKIYFKAEIGARKHLKIKLF